MVSEFDGIAAPGKVELRRLFLKARQAMPLSVWREKSDRLCTHLQTWLLFAQARTVLAYFSFRQEPDLSPLFVTSRKQWGFPRCEGASLIWHAWSCQDATQVGPYGIREPHQDLPVLLAAQVDLILIPAVACDIQGYRLGYGGGFYDRLLDTPEWRSKPTIAIIFDSARIAALPTDPWDQPVQAVCTEAGLFLSGHKC